MSVTPQPVAVLLMAMGGPDCLENVEPYLQDVRGGRPTSPELVEEIRERYRVTGGKSPVLDIAREVARALEQRLNRSGDARYRCYVGLRHWHPFIKETYAELLDAFVTSWHRHPLLIAAIVENIRRTLERFPAEVRAQVPVLFTAHSLPERVVAMKDPYPEEVQGTAQAVCVQLGTQPTRFAYQSHAPGRSGSVHRLKRRWVNWRRKVIVMSWWRRSASSATMWKLCSISILSSSSWL